MAASFQIHEQTYPKEPVSFDSDKATPLDKQIQHPLTPPITDKQFPQGSNRSAVASALQLFEQHRDHQLIDSWTSVQLSPLQYEHVLRQLRQHPKLHGHVEDKVRFDYNPTSMLLSVRMPSTVHEFFIGFFAEAVTKQLEAVRHRGDSSADFASRIAEGRSARIFMKEDSPDGDNQSTRVLHRREPDAQFYHQDAKYSGIVVEVSYSKDGKNLRRLAWDYIQHSNGNIKVVIGFDIGYRNTKEATLSVWRPRYIHEEGEELAILEAEQTIMSELFRAGDGSFENSTNVLCLKLEDFATDELTTDKHFEDSTDVKISYEKLAQFLNAAESIQQLRESTPENRVGGAETKRRTRKRKLSSSPIGELRSADEAEHQSREAMA